MRTDELNLTGRAAIVTGGRSGIGQAVAHVLLGKGVRVATFDVLPCESGVALGRAKSEPGTESSDLPGTELSGSCGSYEYLGFEVDVTDEDAVRDAVKCVTAAWGRLDILVNCAGLLGPETHLVDFDSETWDRVVAVNLKGTFNCMKCCLPYMIEAKWGRVVNFSSTVARRGSPGLSAYAAAKAGILGLTMSVAQEVAEHGITVNAVAPGLIRTGMSEPRIKTHGERLLASIPLRRAGEPGDVADVVLFLVSEGARYITGHCVNINGGMFMAI